MSLLTLRRTRLRPARPIGLALPARVTAALAALPVRLRRWFIAGQTRRALARLDDRLLADIGVSREQAADEAAQPYWRVTGGLPHDWR